MSSDQIPQQEPAEMDLSVYAKLHKNLKHLVWCIKGVRDESRDDGVYTITNLGTGFSVSGNGLVMTCYHVVARATASTDIKVHTLDNSFQGTATIVLTRKESDLALLKVSEMSDCASVVFSRDPISVGQPLVTIGNPPNLVGTYLVGNVCYGCKDVKKSTKGKATCETYVAPPRRNNRILGDVWNAEIFKTRQHGYAFQKSLNPSVPIIQCHGFNVDDGNSGGPVFNCSEELVGMIHGTSFGDDIAIHVTELEDFMNDCKRFRK